MIKIIIISLLFIFSLVMFVLYITKSCDKSGTCPSGTCPSGTCPPGKDCCSKIGETCQKNDPSNPCNNKQCGTFNGTNCGECDSGFNCIPSGKCIKDGNPITSPNVFYYSPGDEDKIKQKLQYIHDNSEDGNGGKVWAKNSYTLLLNPGTYKFNNKLQVPFLTSILGLGETPNSVTLDCDVGTFRGGDATNVFWSNVQNVTITGDITWQISQGGYLRRIIGNKDLDIGNGSTSPLFSDNCKINGKLKGKNTQQYCFKNFTAQDETFGDDGSGVGQVNFVFVNCNLPNKSSCTAIVKPGNEQINPVKTFIDGLSTFGCPYLTQNGINIPVETNNSGHMFASNDNVINYEDIYVIGVNDSVDVINTNILSHKAAILPSYNYNFNKSINITNDDFIFMGIGYPVIANGGKTPSIVVTGSNCVVSGIVLDAGPGNPITLLHVNDPGSGSRLYDICSRIYPTKPNNSNDYIAVQCDSSVIIDQKNGYCENMWLWSADHTWGGQVGWPPDDKWANAKKSNHGLIVNGDNVTAVAIGCEHFDKELLIWSGENGHCIMYQSEQPYVNLYPASPAYKVADTVKNHTAIGLGSYYIFGNKINPFAWETPNNPNVIIKNSVVRCWAGNSYFVNAWKKGNTIIPSDKMSNSSSATVICN